MRAGIVFILFLSSALFIVTCTSEVTTHAPPVETPDSFSDSGTQHLPSHWWTAFNDNTLDSLVTQALQSNFTLKTTWNRLLAARAVVDRESSALFPNLEVFGEGSISQTETATSEQINLGMMSEYEIDIWGRIGSRIQAERFRAEASLADYHAAAISLSAEVARTWYQLVETRNQLELLRQQIETNRKVLNLLNNRFGSGQIRSVDILRQRQLLEATREQKIAVESRKQVLEHQLAVLLGNTPQKGVEYSSDTLPAVQPLPQTGLPVDLVRRRPDIRNAYNQLRAADRDLAAAISSQYPRLTFTASVSTAAENADNLFNEWVTSFAGNLLAPLFNAGELRAEVDRTQAIQKQRLYQYGQATLTAFQEVENALIQEKKQQERIHSLEEQVQLARRSYEQLRIEYLNGVSDYIDVLTALTEEQQLRRDLLSAKLLRLEYRIALYRALAGGFKTDRESIKQ